MAHWSLEGTPYSRLSGDGSGF